MMKKRLLFLCSGNSARSQLAEAILRHKAEHLVDVVSAGTNPETVDERVYETLSLFSIKANGLSAKSISKFTGQHFDYVITLCALANNECRQFEGAQHHYFWDIADPKTRLDEFPFVRTFHELNSRLDMLLATVIDEKVVNSEESYLDAQQFYKCLTDPIRLKILLMSHFAGELCVCELMEVLAEESQPKVSRNLAVLRSANILNSRKHGQWVFYHINPSLPQWAKTVIAVTTESNTALINTEILRLNKMQNRPDKVGFCR